MPNHPTNAVPAPSWETHPQAWQLIREVVREAVDRSAFARHLSQLMTTQSGTRLIDWLDHIVLPADQITARKLEDVGYAVQPDDAPTVYRHTGGVFPAVLVQPNGGVTIALKADSVADFAAVHQIQTPIEGEPLSLFRRLLASSENGVDVTIIERHGFNGFAPPKPDRAQAIARLRHAEIIRSRRRQFETDDAGFDHAEQLIKAALADGLTPAIVCDLFFAAEREFWMRRNYAARVQYARQQRIGLGWANHDHHTYRCSRQNFTRLVRIWEMLGLRCRERFYAGAEAGWGAQVMEQPLTGIITFNDVDLSPTELMGDFAHEPLPAQPTLGTVGLWCGLHGDSFLQAGMHHLECQFDFDALRDQLEAEYNVKTMKPFTDFPHLRQAFTEGERWAVRPERIERLLKAGLITEAQAQQFRENGAIGSHLENLERNDGFKGFNQSGVSEIIAATDPRKQLAAK